MDRNLIFLKIYFYFYFLPMCMSVLPVCTPVSWAHAWHLRGQEKGVTPPETRIVNVVCCHVGTGYRTQVFWRESQVLVLSLLCSPRIYYNYQMGGQYTHITEHVWRSGDNFLELVVFSLLGVPEIKFA